MGYGVENIALIAFLSLFFFSLNRRTQFSDFYLVKLFIQTLIGALIFHSVECVVGRPNFFSLRGIFLQMGGNEWASWKGLYKMKIKIGWSAHFLCELNQLEGRWLEIATRADIIWICIGLSPDRIIIILIYLAVVTNSSSNLSNWSSVWLNRRSVSIFAKSFNLNAGILWNNSVGSIKNLIFSIISIQKIMKCFLCYNFLSHLKKKKSNRNRWNTPRKELRLLRSFAIIRGDWHHHFLAASQLYQIQLCKPIH